MSSDSRKGLQPIIIKKVIKKAHGHHGGAWKIAYADFVTAMMAFFLLMWLLGSTATGDLNGIAEYFQTPLRVALQGGTGSGQSSSIVPGGGKDLSRSNGQVRKGGAPQSKAEYEAARARRDAERIQQLHARIAAMISNDPRLAEHKSQIRLDVSLDGLRIQLVDEQNRPMFDSGSALVKPYMRDILQGIGSTLSGIENLVSLEGHTDASPYGNGERGYSNWELSADRANASRRELVAGGMPDDKLVRVTGLASSNLLEPADPRAAVNRRISILVLTHAAQARLMGTDAEKSAPEAPAAAPVPAPATVPPAPGAAPEPHKP